MKNNVLSLATLLAATSNTDTTTGGVMDDVDSDGSFNDAADDQAEDTAHTHAHSHRLMVFRKAADGKSISVAQEDVECSKVEERILEMFQGPPNTFEPSMPAEIRSMMQQLGIGGGSMPFAVAADGPDADWRLMVQIWDEPGVPKDEDASVETFLVGKVAKELHDSEGLNFEAAKPGEERAPKATAQA